MMVRRLCASLAPALIVGLPADSTAVQVERNPEVSEIPIPVDGASLYSRVVGHGLPVIVLHGGPDFDHRYLLPELDEWKDEFRLVYYDQRGRGRSADGVRAEDVTLEYGADFFENFLANPQSKLVRLTKDV